ncbi:hypothetical protein [Lentilactobacillus sp. Marseille-Q4993]|uniref:hypothetical protein n=1 Tax=Lentilactobacillus sp. Marseille-Q4993 TaxID=3039492 RepID=UPI0024BD29CA|nr:hypothetical protein [Lentilactobacillus sp. Marseille-Q4993]
MSSVKVENGELKIELTGLDRLLSRNSTVSVPVSHITNYSIGKKEQFKKNGKWSKKSDKAFVAISGDKPVLIAKLCDDSYDYIFASVDNPQELASKIS